jgi:methyltransferase-like protein 6
VEAGFEIRSNVYIHRRTINKKEDLDVPRIFVQGKFQKPL